MSEYSSAPTRTDTPNNRERNPNVAEPAMTYEVSADELSPDPDVTVVFHGLLTFFFDGARQCQIGIPNTTQGLGHEHRHPHEFEVSVWTKVAGECPSSPLTFPIKNPKSIQRVDIQATNPIKPGVFVHEKPPFDSFDRIDPHDQNDPNDWRWVLDFESSLLYGDGVNHKRETLVPSVFINCGTFYTLHKTFSKFRLHPSDGTGDVEIGSVSEIQGCNIDLKPGGLVTVTIAPLPPPIFLLGGIGLKYQIDITNNCRKQGKPCTFTPNTGPKEDRNDFYLYYETFNRPANTPEFQLQLSKFVDVEPTLGICTEKEGNKKIESSKDSPCGGSGAGQTPSLP